MNEPGSTPTPEPIPPPRQAQEGVPGAAIAALCLLLFLLSGYLLWSKATTGSGGTATPIGSANTGISSVKPADAVPAADTTTGAPKLAVDREKIALGDIKLGKTVRVDFRLTNTGQQPLQILEAPYVEVVQGCCPPRPAVGATSLAPGQATQLSMQFMMHAGMGGPHLFRVHVKTNDPTQPDRTLDVTSNWVE